jgi:hypothetical protein
MNLKHYSLLFIILFVSTACVHSSASIDLQDEKEVRTAVAATWEAEYLETRGDRNKMPEDMITQVTFIENGTYTVGIKNDEIKQAGKWGYDPKTHMLNFSKENENGSSRILKLTEKELIISAYRPSNMVVFDSTVVTYKKL